MPCLNGHGIIFVFVDRVLSEAITERRLPVNAPMNLEERLGKVFREVFELKELPAKNELIYKQFPKWNSLGHMSLVTAIETDFDCILDTNDVLAMSSFQKALEIVSRIHGSA